MEKSTKTLTKILGQYLLSEPISRDGVITVPKLTRPLVHPSGTTSAGSVLT